jgi:hypothetical protein
LLPYFQRFCEIFQCFWIITQRFIDADRKAKLSTHNIETLGGTAIPQGDIPAAITALRAQLGESIPKAAGKPRMNLLQQLEDFAQFGGWVDDVKSRTLDAITSASPNKLHTPTIMANETYLVFAEEPAEEEKPYAERIKELRESAGLYV